MLSLRDVSLYFEQALFKNISLDFKPGELTVITGESGSGKSSLLKLINGVITQCEEAKIEGQIFFQEKDFKNMSILERSFFISTVFQNPKTQFYCINSTNELAFQLENRNMDPKIIKERISTYTKLLNTKKLLDRNIFELSGGEKQIMAVTASAVSENDIILLDEPSASLDPAGIEKLKAILSKLKNKNKIIIVFEHRLYYLKEIMDQIGIIHDKKIDIFQKNSFSDDFFKNFLKSII